MSPLFLRTLLFFCITLTLSAPDTRSQSAAEAGGDSLDVKLGQMLMVGFRGITASPGSPIMNDIERLHLGGVILFDFDVEQKKYGRNIVSPQQLRYLTEALKEQAALPLLVAVDQEGGLVARLKQKAGFPRNVSQADLGEMDNDDSTLYYAGVTARSLAVVGVNQNFAPVLDVNINKNNPVIGKLGRSFSSDPAIVAKHGALMVRAHREARVLTAVKHFPGHGSSRSDSHLGLVDVSDTWSRKELQPFQDLIRQGLCDMVMTAHIFNSKLDPDWPATLSQKTITGLLRGEMKFDGVVISDDMNMKAISDHYGLETAVRQAVNAGVDILLFGNNGYEFVPDLPSRAHAALKALVLKGDIPRERIEQSYARIMELKKRLKPAP
ncbi:MAG: glycoside hydrolase family 3 protein [Bacteroidia bacterium]|nr:glycoside hydrolase family 3 protein [Bacteroidia bacterium]